MMGVQQNPQNSLFHFGINIDKRIRANHPLRKINELIDFNFAYDEVKNLYGTNGNVSVPPRAAGHFGKGPCGPGSPRGTFFVLGSMMRCFSTKRRCGRRNGRQGACLGSVRSPFRE